MAKINVSWETVTDGKTLQGQGFENQMRVLLDSGDELSIDLPDGSTKKFINADAFSVWFESLN